MLAERPQSRDQRQISAKICRGTATLGHLKGDVAAMADHIRVEFEGFLGELLGYQSSAPPPWHRQRTMKCDSPVSIWLVMA